jgi:uncharacterized protein
MDKRLLFLLTTAFFLLACAGSFSLPFAYGSPVLPTLASTAVPLIFTPTLAPTQPFLPATNTPPAADSALSLPLAVTPAAVAVIAPVSLAIATAEPVATADIVVVPALADAYSNLTIDALTDRAYGGGELQIIRVLPSKERFARYLIAYPSDGLTVYGFMNVPHEGDNFPVALVLHGYMPVDRYQTLTYTTRYADILAEAGFLVLHPSFRNHPPSDHGPNPFRVGYAIDTLNLIALVQEQGRLATGPLRRANPDSIHLWGHSMGGGIALRVLTVNPGIRSAVLYGSMSGDERRNFEHIVIWSKGERGQAEVAAPDEALALISPIFFLDRIQTPLAIHHGQLDDVTPPAWSDELCLALQTRQKQVECFTYPGQEHTFRGHDDLLFMERVIAFFRQH